MSDEKQAPADPREVELKKSRDAWQQGREGRQQKRFSRESQAKETAAAEMKRSKQDRTGK